MVELNEFNEPISTVSGSAVVALTSREEADSTIGVMEAPNVLSGWDCVHSEKPGIAVEETRPKKAIFGQSPVVGRTPFWSILFEGIWRSQKQGYPWPTSMHSIPALIQPSRKNSRLVPCLPRQGCTLVACLLLQCKLSLPGNRGQNPNWGEGSGTKSGAVGCEGEAVGNCLTLAH